MASYIVAALLIGLGLMIESSVAFWMGLCVVQVFAWMGKNRTALIGAVVLGLWHDAYMGTYLGMSALFLIGVVFVVRVARMSAEMFVGMWVYGVALIVYIVATMVFGYSFGLWIGLWQAAVVVGIWYVFQRFDRRDGVYLQKRI